MTDSGPTIGLVLDCQEPLALAEFWTPALDYVSLGEADAYVVQLPNGRPGPKLLRQRVPNPRSQRTRTRRDRPTPARSGAGPVRA